jgi:signal transduction histidine kinase/CheY-like chemotaxis protein
VIPLLEQILEAPGRAVAALIRLAQQNLRLRSKLLLSFVLVVAGMTCVILLAVRNNAERMAQQRIEQDAHNAVLVFQVLQRQETSALSRKADLLAWVASMRDGDVTTIDDASADPWQSEDCNLFVLADKNGHILKLHTAVDDAAHSGPLATDAHQLLARYLSEGQTFGWWLGGDTLYEVILQPYYSDAAARNDVAGYVIVGRSVDQNATIDLARITSSSVAFRYGREIAISTLPALQEQELGQKFAAQLAASGSENVAGEVKVGGKRYFETSLLLTPGNRPSAELIVLKSYTEVDAYLAHLNHLLLGMGIIAILAGGALVFFISDTVTRPIGSLVKGVEALALGDYGYPLTASGQDETSTLTRAFESMRRTLQNDQEQRAELELQLRQSQKMEALGRLAGGVAHDFNNLLTVIRGHSEMILERMQAADPFFANAQQIRKTADRAAALTRQMLAFSRMQMVQPKVLDANELISDMGKLLRRLVREDIEFNLKLGESLGRIKADPGQIEQVLLNLTVNASDAMPRGGKLTIETQNVTVDRELARTRPSIVPGKFVTLSVTDTGHGMTAETMARIFEPFFTTKEPGKGTGLGLATVYGVVKQSSGFIWVESEVNVGTRFEIYLPRTEERAEANFDAVMKKHETAAIAKKLVLVVEDEREVRDLVCQFLQAAGYNVLTAENGKEALDIAERMGKAIHAVLADVVMPHMRGTELGAKLRAMLPHLKIVYMTGYLDPGDAGATFPGDALFLQKPFSRETVVSVIAEALRGKPKAAASNAPSAASVEEPQFTR